MAIGWDYTDVYIAACLRPFNTRREGLAHERNCPDCQRAIRGDEETEDQEDDT